MKTILRKKIAESEEHIAYNEYNFFGFVAHKKGFLNPWFTSLIPFANGRAAWHFFGFRFTKSQCYVHKYRNEINGWYTTDNFLIKKLRSL